MCPARKLWCVCLPFVLWLTMVLAFPSYPRVQKSQVRTQNAITYRPIDGFSSQRRGSSRATPHASPKATPVYYVQRDGRVVVEGPITPHTSNVKRPLYHRINAAPFQSMLRSARDGHSNKQIVHLNILTQHNGIRGGNAKLAVDNPYENAVYVRKSQASGPTIDQRLEMILAKSENNGAHFPMNSNTVVMELDMLMTKAQYRYYYEGPRSQLSPSPRRLIKRKALKSKFTLWPGATVPYYIERHTFSTKDQNILHQSMQEWMDKTCIRFVRARHTDSDVLKVKNGNGCTAFVGRIGGEQHLMLHDDCRDKHIMTHELGHVIGLVHEHQRPDRDRFITVATHNVGKGQMKNYQKFNANRIDVHGVEYDYTSIMHYGKTAFSRDGVSTTMITKDPDFQDIIGTGSTVTFKDAKLVNVMYQCSDHCMRPPNCGTGFVNKHCQCVCPDGTQICDTRAWPNIASIHEVRPWGHTRDYTAWAAPDFHRHWSTETDPSMFIPYTPELPFSWYPWRPFQFNHPRRRWVASKPVPRRHSDPVDCPTGAPRRRLVPRPKQRKTERPTMMPMDPIIYKK